MIVFLCVLLLMSSYGSPNSTKSTDCNTGVLLEALKTKVVAENLKEVITTTSSPVLTETTLTTNTQSENDLTFTTTRDVPATETDETTVAAETWKEFATTIPTIEEVATTDFQPKNEENVNATSDTPVDDPDQTVSPCGVPQLANGRVRFRNSGQLVKFKCDVGFQQVGRRYASCRNGTWDIEMMPICTKPGCPAVESKTARIHPSKDGSWLVFICHVGYDTVDHYVIFCDGNKWNDTVPTCVPRFF